MTIRRYDVAFGKEIEHEHGPWVRYRDAARLEEEIGTYLDRLQEAHEEIAVLREALRRVVLHYTAEALNGDGIMEDAWDDVAAAKTLADSDAVRFDVPAIERGLASIRKAAGVER